ncbi:hypothetical protein ATO6_20580 [Oceanicola sp. 22II-s10i]|nr:hypothetical protein ATO6_20580 [Oceanicola sp. 22II-s10i]
MFGAAAATAEPLTLRFSTIVPNRGTSGADLNWIADQIKERSNGDLDVEIFWGGALAAPADTARAVGDGLADMGTVVTSYTPGLLDLYEVGNLLIGPSNPWVAQQAAYELATENEDVVKQFTDRGLHYVTNLNAGLIQLICREPINSVEDLKGLKIRTGGPYTEVLSRMGATTIAIPQSEVYQALDTGVVDCNQIYHIAVDSFRQYEVAKHVITLEFGMVMAYAIFMNNDLWNEMTDEQRAVITEVGKDFNQRVVREHIAAVEEVKTRLAADQGVIYADPPAEMLEQIKTEGADLAKTWIASVEEKGLPAQTVFEDYQAMIAKYQADFDANGYPWK